MTSKRPRAGQRAPAKHPTAEQRTAVELDRTGGGTPFERPNADPRVAAEHAAASGRPAKAATGHRARSHARRLTLQALYQMQMNPRPLASVESEFAADPEAERADIDYFRALLAAIEPHREALDARLAGLCQIPPHELDPIEHAVLWLGLHELESRLELPYRVALAEAVELAKQFGATDGHKFVNAVLDRAARDLRPHEYGLPG